MISGIYHEFIYQPLYNGLVFLIAHLDPIIGVGGVVIIFTILVKTALFPLSRKALQGQIKMKELEPALAKIRKEFKGNPQEMSAQTMKVYKENKLNPFSSILLLLIQIPIIIALYRIFLTGGLPEIHTDILYSFIKIPGQVVDMVFLGIDITKKSLILALLAGITQYFQVKFSIPNAKTTDIVPKDSNEKPEFATEMTKAMNTQMKYVLPVIVVIIAYTVNAAIALYWTTSNIFAIVQEVLVRRKLKSKVE